MASDAGAGPTIALSFANNFWGKEDAGVSPLLQRMHNAKLTCDELRLFYGARASIEDDYARKLLSLCRKSLGSQETGTLKHSLDTVRGEVESMGRQHQNIAAQMRSELEEPLAAFTGGMKERRKIIQNTIEKLLKVKMQQTGLVNKTRDRYEQECLKIKGYLAQGHMVMGQEERKNKAKLEKTQINLATSNAEYEAAVKALEETTARWNREWKAAADKFQDLEEERLDFTKSSLWTFANVASTVCVSDDAGCEKIRLSLEKMEVEKDIAHFIREKGTGQEIPDPPKYINFCRGDVDTSSEASLDQADDNYRVAQFPRSINPAFRSSSPQPSTLESHHDPNSALAREMMGRAAAKLGTRTSLGSEQETTRTPQQAVEPVVPPPQQQQAPASLRGAPAPYQARVSNSLDYDPTDFAPVPHEPYPLDGMTMLCRPTASDLSTAPSTTPSARPSSRDDGSERTSFDSQEGPPPDRKAVLSKKSGFFQGHSPFRRKSQKDLVSNRSTWQGDNNYKPARPALAGRGDNKHGMLLNRSVSPVPEPIDANASLALNVGNNVFAVQNTDRGKAQQQNADATSLLEDDPIAIALAELKGVTSHSVGNVAGGKQSAGRISADHYHGITTPVPASATCSVVSVNNNSCDSPSRPARRRANPSCSAYADRPPQPPGYDTGAAVVSVARLGVPPPAVTSRAMKASSDKFLQQTRSLFGASGGPVHAHQANHPAASAAGGGGGRSKPDFPVETRSAGSPSEFSRTTSPVALIRSASPRPGSRAAAAQAQAQQDGYLGGGRGLGSRASASPSPNAASYATGRAEAKGGSNSIYGGGGSHQPRGGVANGGYYRSSPRASYSGHQSPVNMHHRATTASPNSYHQQQQARPRSSMSGMSGLGGGMGIDMDDGGGSYAESMPGHRPGPTSSNSGVRGAAAAVGGISLYEPGGVSRARSRSVADLGRFTGDGRPIMHFARAMYVYQAAIPEELGFNKGDVLAVLRHQDDGWWEAMVQGGDGLVGLVPSNYLQLC